MKSFILALGILFLLPGSFVNGASAIKCELTTSMPDENDAVKWVLYYERKHDVTESKYYKSTENEKILLGVHSYFNQKTKKVWGCEDEEGRIIDQSVAVLKNGKWFVFSHASSPTISLTKDDVVLQILIKVYNQAGNLLTEVLLNRPN